MKKLFMITLLSSMPIVASAGSLLQDIECSTDVYGRTFTYELYVNPDLYCGASESNAVIIAKSESGVQNEPALKEVLTGKVTYSKSKTVATISEKVAPSMPDLEVLKLSIEDSIVDGSISASMLMFVDFEGGQQKPIYETFILKCRRQFTYNPDCSNSL